MGESSGSSVRAGAPPPMPLPFFGFATALMGITFYLLIEVNITIQRFFKKRGGLYYWSLLVASFGTCIHTISFIIQWWVPGAPWILCAALGQFGWSFMVTAQSLVLYSRLHLVIRNHTIIRGCLLMIIVTSIAVEIPNWVTSWFAYDTDYSVTKLWTPRDDIMLRISQLVLFLQESCLSILYIWGVVKALTPNDRINVNRIKWDLIAISSFIIATDLANVILTYTSEHFAKEPIQNFSYAFKLRVEFAVLNQLMSVTSQSRSINYNGGGRYVKETGWSNDSSGGGAGGADVKLAESGRDRKRKHSSPDEGYSSISSPSQSEKSSYSLAALRYGSDPSTKSLRHHGSGSISSNSPGRGHGHGHGAEADPERLPRARLQPSREQMDEGIITVRHAINQHREMQQRQQRENEGMSPFYLETYADATPENGNGHGHEHAAGAQSWWDRLLYKVDPPEDERWRRDLSRV